MIGTNAIVEKDLREQFADFISYIPNIWTESKKKKKSWWIWLRFWKNLFKNLESVISDKFSRYLKTTWQKFKSPKDVLPQLYVPLWNVIFFEGSREHLSQLHLNSLHKLCPNVFALDMLNYARLTLVYLGKTFNLKQNNRNT